jgi:hypothetical protein
MESKDQGKLKKNYVYVKDDNGVVYICKQNELKKPDEMTKEELDACMIPPGDA